MDMTEMFREVNGILFFKLCQREAILSGLNYKPRSGDLFVTGYPRCGNTWLRYIVTAILWKGKFPDDELMFFLGCPYLEWCGADCVNYMIKPGGLSTHIPFHAVPYSPDAKYLYISRNPRDCCVSLYNFLNMMSSNNENRHLSFDQYFEHFLQDNFGYGGYFNHVIEWYIHRNDSNVCFITYENLKKDPRTEILKIAKFIGEEYEKSILENQQIMENILYYSSFEYMNKRTNKSVDIFLRYGNTLLNKEFPIGFKESVQYILSEGKRKEPVTEFVRKGIIGDWKNYFKEDQLKRLDAKFEEKAAGSDIKQLWKDIYDV